MDQSDKTTFVGGEREIRYFLVREGVNLPKFHEHHRQYQKRRIYAGHSPALCATAATGAERTSS